MTKGFKWTGWIKAENRENPEYVVMRVDWAKDENGNLIPREECAKCEMFLDDSDFHDEKGNCL